MEEKEKEIRTHDDSGVFICMVDIDENNRTILKRGFKNKDGEIPLEDFLQEVTAKANRIRERRTGHTRRR